MSVMFDVHTRNFGEQIDDLIRATGKEAAKVVRDEARLFVQDVIKHTPPFGPTPSTETYNEQRRIGENAVERDIKRTYQGLEELKLFKGGDEKLLDRLRKLARQRRVEDLKDTLRDLGIKNPEVFIEVDPNYHAGKRDRRGRVRSGKGRATTNRAIVLKETTLRRYIREKKAHVGKAKAGWVTAAQGLGISLPKWITRHSQPGQFIDKTHDARQPSVTVANLVSWIQDTGADLRIINRALENRVRVMKIKLEKILEAAKRRTRKPSGGTNGRRF